MRIVRLLKNNLTILFKKIQKKMYICRLKRKGITHAFIFG